MPLPAAVPVPRRLRSCRNRSAERRAPGFRASGASTGCPSSRRQSKPGAMLRSRLPLCGLLLIEQPIEQPLFCRVVLLLKLKQFGRFVAGQLALAELALAIVAKDDGLLADPR